ncbi:MAG TPA: DEAD/DEAH box helicase [Thermoanaerobaculia bacterium]|nr:DEAD/DEAH box helicase [Thermoanaerobaculia bacterium]
MLHRTGRQVGPLMALRGIPQHTTQDGARTFAELGLSPELVEAVERLGLLQPTPIQALVVPLALAGGDLVGLAQTGSGKTAAFVLPLLDMIEPEGGVQALIVCPTREIALQTAEFVGAVGNEVGLRAAALIGGVALRPQIQALEREGVELVIATPGRLLDHVRRRTVRLDAVTDLVLDEADHMLDLGFLPQVRDILEELPKERRTMMFSATLPPAIERLAHRFMRDPAMVDLRSETHARPGVEHQLYLVDPADKKACLLALVAEEKTGSILVFMRRRVDADWACRQLSLEGHAVERMHADRQQRHREEALEGFRRGDLRILVATDLAARGIDVPTIEHIINFDVPATVEDYIHRSGRTARGSMGGIVSTIATWRDKSMIQSIESALGEELPRLVAPGVAPWVEAKTPSRAQTRSRRRLL